MTFTRIKVQRIIDGTTRNGSLRVAHNRHKPGHIFVEAPTRMFSLSPEQAIKLTNAIADYLEDGAA